MGKRNAAAPIRLLAYHHQASLPVGEVGQACAEMNMKEKLEPQELCTIECDRQMSVTRFSPCGKYLFAGGYDASVRRWDVTAEEPKSLPSINGHHGWVQGIELQPDGELLFSSDSWGGLRATRYAEAKLQTVWSHEQAHGGWIRAMSLSEDGKMIATAGRDRYARIWSSADGKLLHETSEHPEEVYAAAIHPEKKILVTGDLHGVLRCWDLATGKCAEEKKFEKMHLYERIQDVGGLRLLHFHDDGKTLICAGAEPQRAGRSIAIPTIHWLDWPSLEIKHTAQFGPEKQGFIFDLTWHPAGYWAVVSSGQPGNGQFLLLRPTEEKPFFITTKMSNCHSLAVHPEGRIAVAATNRRSQGNGAVKDKEGNYLGNWSPIHLFDPPKI